MYAPPAIPEQKRSILREVALAYRRAYREGKAVGLSPPEYQRRAVDAALAAYLRLDPDAPADRLEASAMANLMIANAIRAGIRWFWHGPDA